MNKGMEIERKIAHHQGTNGGEAYKAKCHHFWKSVRFHVELAYLTEGSFAGAARELNRKRIKTMKEGGKWHPYTVQVAINHYEKFDVENNSKIYNEEQAKELEDQGFDMVEITKLDDDESKFVIGFDNNPTYPIHNH
ncbi:hypothetical protein [Vibrio metschnikovii]|uniref:hypothetical protein n=1 Tax=Vibrio metschnikovii TaxID=28172 RepID=UPI0013020F9A|nr:hypothetical protein [Vibrio metschnikovii]